METPETCAPVPVPDRIQIINSNDVTEILPTGLRPTPFGEVSFTEMIDIFAEKALSLKEQGATAFVIKDMSYLSEMRASIFGCQKSSLPMLRIKQMTLEKLMLIVDALAVLSACRSLVFADLELMFKTTTAKALAILQTLFPSLLHMQRFR